MSDLQSFTKYLLQFYGKHGFLPDGLMTSKATKLSKAMVYVRRQELIDMGVLVKEGLRKYNLSEKAKKVVLEHFSS